MAGAGYKLFNTGDVLTAQQVNEYLMQQTVMVFADATARTTALSGVLAEGMLSYLKSTDATEVYNGSAWVALAADQTPLTTKGDLFTYTTADARLASSNVNGDVLTVDTSTATGLKWAAPAASGGMTLIQETVASGLSSLSFSSLPSTYKHLYLTWSGVYHSTTGSVFNVRLNNDSSNIYGQRTVYYDGSFSQTGTNLATQWTDDGNQAPFGRDATQTEWYNRGAGWLFIENYASTTRDKNLSGSWMYTYTGVGFRIMFTHIGIFKTTTAVTSLDILRVAGSATFSNMTNTSIRLYGVS